MLYFSSSKIYYPFNSDIVNKLLIVTDYKQCPFMSLQCIRQYIHTRYVNIIGRLIRDNHIRGIFRNEQTA